MHYRLNACAAERGHNENEELRAHETRQEGRNLAKQFLSEYDIVVRSIFHPHTDGRTRSDLVSAALAKPDFAARSLRLYLILICCFVSSALFAQDWVKTGTSLGVEKVRLAVPDFKPSTTDPQNAALLKTFNDTLWNDLDVSGVVELVSKSFYPLQVPGQPPEVNFLAWNAPPPNAAMLAFGSLGVAAGS